MRIEIDDQGVYRDHNGQAHVRCKADPSSPFFINVSSSLIETIWKGDRCRIDLALVKLPCDIMEAAKSYLIKKLEVTSPLMLYPFFRSLKLLEQAWQTQWADFSDISLGELFKILLNGNRHYAAELRRFYSYCASEHLADADEVLALEMKSLTIHNRNSYAAVLKWDETRGALTSAEQELVRRDMTVGDISEPIADITARLFTWISFETLKRPLQVATTTADAVWIPDNNSDNSQYFLKIPKAKFQTGEKPELWPITEKLAHQIFSYSRIPLVREKQLQTNTLLVSLKDGLKPTFGRMVTNWCTRRGIISPRTKKPLVLTPYRIRHTGATQMAAQGASSDEIQYILEHDSTDAVRAYIDCLASEFRPLIERANRKLGHIFSELNNLYFNGSIGDAATGSPVLIPALNMPALVGGCTKNGSCGQHPFFSCYNGCRYFIAWRDADHQKSLVYLEKEMLRWGAAEGGKDRSKFLRDLEQTYQAVKDVLRCIDNGE